MPLSVKQRIDLARAESDAAKAEFEAKHQVARQASEASAVQEQQPFFNRVGGAISSGLSAGVDALGSGLDWWQGKVRSAANELPDMSPRAELAARAFYSGLGGDKVLEDMDPARRLQAVNALEESAAGSVLDKTGAYGTAALLTGLQYAGPGVLGAPLQAMFRAGKAATALAPAVKAGIFGTAEGAPTAARVVRAGLGAGIEGAATNVLPAPEGSRGEAMLIGGGLGALAGGGITALAEGAPAMRAAALEARRPSPEPTPRAQVTAFEPKTIAGGGDFPNPDDLVRMADANHRAFLDAVPTTAQRMSAFEQTSPGRARVKESEVPTAVGETFDLGSRGNVPKTEVDVLPVTDVIPATRKEYLGAMLQGDDVAAARDVRNRLPFALRTPGKDQTYRVLVELPNGKSLVDNVSAASPDDALAEAASKWGAARGRNARRVALVSDEDLVQTSGGMAVPARNVVQPSPVGEAAPGAPAILYEPQRMAPGRKLKPFQPDDTSGTIVNDLESITPTEVKPPPQQNVEAQVAAQRQLRPVEKVSQVAAQGPASLLPRQLKPGEVVTPKQLVQEMDPAAVEAAEMAHKEIYGNPGLQRWIKQKYQQAEQGAYPPEFRASHEMVAAAIRSINATKAIYNRQVADIYGRLSRLAKSKTDRDFFNRFVESQDSKNPIPIEALPSQVRDFEVKQYDVHYKMMEDVVNMLAEMGATNQGMNFANKLIDDAKAGRVWFHREYLQKLLGKRYEPKKDVVAAAYDYVSKNAKEGVTPEQAREALGNWLKQVKLGADPSAGKSNLSAILKRRATWENAAGEEVDLPKEIRDLMGEIKDGSLAAAVSFAEGEKLWRSLKVSQQFTAPDLKGITWSDKPLPGWQKIDGEVMQHGAFAGKYVPAELHESIMLSPREAQFNPMLEWIGRTASFLGGGVSKSAATTLSHTAYLNNWFGNFLYSAAAGLEPWRWKTARRLSQSARAMWAYSKNSRTQLGGAAPSGAEAKWMQWALEDGAVKPGLGSEIAGSQTRAIVEAMLVAEKEGVGGTFARIGALLKKGNAKLGSAYDAIDTHWRLANYMEQVEDGMRRGLGELQARARAARIVDENFASSSSVGPWVSQTQKLTGAAQPFLGFFASNAQVHARWARGLDPRLGLPSASAADKARFNESLARSFRVLSFYTLLSGVQRGLLARGGWSDRDVAAAEGSTRGGYLENRPFRIWLGSLDEFGRKLVIDLSNVLGTSFVFRGDPAQSLHTRFLVNLVGGIMEGGGWGNEFRRGLEMFGLDDEEYQKPIRPGLHGQAIMERMIEYGLPGTLKNVRDAARRSDIGEKLQDSRNNAMMQMLGDAIGRRGKYEEQYTPGQAWMRALTNFPVEPVGELSAAGANRAIAAKRGALQSQRKSVLNSPLSPNQKEDSLRAINDELEEIMRRQSRRDMAVQSGRQGK